MKIYNALFQDFEQIDKWINNLDLNNKNQCLISIHSSALPDTECLSLAKHIKQLLPHAIVNGCHVTSVIYNTQTYSNETLISINEFEYGKVFSKIESTQNLSAEAIANSIAQSSKIISTRFATLLFTADQNNCFEITNHLTRLAPEINFVGGVTGKIDEFGGVESFIFDDQAIYRNAYLVNFIGNEFVLTYSNIILGHPPISDVFTITKSHGECIDEIDNIPALQWFSENLGLDKFNSTENLTPVVPSEILLRFPLVLEGYNSSTRFLKYSDIDKSISLYNTNLQEGQQFRVGYLSPLKCIDELQETCHSLQMTPAETIFCYSCIFRDSFSHVNSQWELSAFKDNALCGAFLLGEIGTKNHQTQLLNGASCFFTLAETADHIVPDLSVFESIGNLLHGNDELIEQIKVVEKTLNSSIFSSFIEHEKRVQARLSHVSEENFGTIPQFLNRQADNAKQQICLVSIEEFEKHLFVMGEANFEKYALENKKQIVIFLNKQYPQYHFKFYRYDSAHFFFTVEEKISNPNFVGIIRSLQINCGNWYPETESSAYYNNFTFTLHGLSIQQLLEATKVQTLEKEQKRFNHCDTDGLFVNNLHEEFHMVAALKSIVKSNSIVPYFQGIYDNKKNRFHMYEALMRLQHPDGKMLFPNDFMDIAKKYDLYLSLSLAMVVKVFELFKHRHETITINISAYDILSQEFKDTVFEHLKSMPNPQNFVFELVETEAFTDLETLRSFIHRVKQYGCKVAVDDFGAGYSNFIEFGNLDVDYLKINGSLTKLLGTDFNYNHILNSIAFMGEKMQVQLIAEFVETAATQKLLIQSGVQYSQGYFFSKPMPFAELVVVSKENTKKSEDEVEERVEAKDTLLHNEQMKKENAILLLGGFIVALLTIISVVSFVNYNRNEFKTINDSFLVELATGLSDKVALFAEESEISLQIMSVAMSEHAEHAASQEEYHQELARLNSATKFDATYVSFNGEPAMNGRGHVLDIPMELIYNKAIGNEVVMLPMMTDSNGVKIIIFAANIRFNGRKVGEIYGTYKVEDISELLALSSFGGEAFYHICQVDGTPIYLSGSAENAFTSGDMYNFIGSLDIFNGHTPETIKKDMYAGRTVLLNYYLNGEERSAVMVRIPNTDWCIVSIVLNEVNTQMLRSTNRSTLVFIVFFALLYMLYFAFTTTIFRKHRLLLLEILDASRSLSSSLQMSIEKDSLTGTYSRATAIEKISDVISSQNQKDVTHALAILDIDNFKYINDTYGHHTGDIYLQSFVSAVKLGIKPGNILGRLGGDEFLLLLNNVKNKEEIEETFDNIFANIHKITLGGVDLTSVSVSAGIVILTENERTYEELMIEADNTLYKAKREGKNKYLFSDE